MNHSILSLIEKTRSIGTWSLDVAASTCDWSPATYRIHEEDPSKRIRLEDGISYYVPEHRSIIERCVQEGIHERRPWDIELQILTATGRRRWVRAIGEPVFEGADLIRLQGVFEDIDERKSLEVEREDMLRRIMEGERIARLGHWWWDATSDAMEWTPGTFRLHGKSESLPAPTLQEHFAQVHPDDRERLRALHDRAVETRTSYTAEFRLVCGETGKHVRSEASPKHDAEGDLVGFTGVSIERTNEVQAQLRIEELNRRLTLALEGARIGVWDWNLITNELIWDPRMYGLYGVEETEFSGAYEAWERGLHPEDRTEAVEKIQRAIVDRVSFDAIFRVLWPDGTVRTIQGMGDLVLDAGGKPVRMVGVNWDITEIVRTRAELERSNEELVQFAYRTSHDLSSPLTAIRRLATYMQQDLVDGRLEEVALNVAAIEKRVSAMEEMVLGILNTAKADLTTVHPEPIDLGALLGDLAEDHRALSEEMGVDLQWSVEVPEPPCLTRIRLYQILTNLIGNGIKFADRDRAERWVRVTATCREERLYLTVEDNGTGMPSADDGQPYEMFARFHSGVSGSGLGLYIVKKHIGALGGKIRYETSPEGTRFHLDLPMKPSTPLRADHDLR
ncbi:Phytochrome-like protein cph1 [Planctomycetes bacterium Poly30]|uniref:histidine kinase n=1 Tax=Saltatorellus ferox TaxID=2528018 RepID=A0A518F0Y9_9BACT|nr:Phytochrome-like protein cph1 [Planctomycetes bacterium Poly30]